jgi:hypothetical protein
MFPSLATGARGNDDDHQNDKARNDGFPQRLEYSAHAPSPF